MDGESEGILQSSFDMDVERRRPRRRSPSAMSDVMEELPLSNYKTNLPFFSATVITATTPDRNSRKSLSIPSLKITPFSGI